MAEPRSLYIHIPFCVRKCRYCSFVSVADAPLSPKEYTDLLLREMALRAGCSPTPPRAPTLYLGGGTPSLLPPEEVGRIVEAAGRLWGLESGAEVTLEANPGTVTPASLTGYRAAGVNRLSLGVQSFDDRMLVTLGRLHSGREAREAFDAARRAGFDSVGIDLIHSLPAQDIGHWREELRCAATLSPEHLSAYGLTVEEGTPFARLEAEGGLLLPDEEGAARMFEETAEILAAHGYEHYEISNYARPGRRSRHNQVYWRREGYVGFGAGAHSFLPAPRPGIRWKNPDDLARYGSLLAAGGLPDEEIARLTTRDAMGEWLFLGLRLLDGVEIARFGEEFGTALETVYGGELERLRAAALLEFTDTRLRLTRRGVLLSNQVFARFL
ncbi:radical SAM family heme chaperone HemW [Geobacter pickeringii]|uniref:Heme chaperone HemW n=1 Tax=Geobacter pickeringii TaxID=345632 RepID=A0A0B5BKX9_9BACT|nr:radical SAM family heme chaperone HemW [Geobacter pickeringii]AJE04731.1 coproporphyrinogen III oxidase [Geobacter pickeringii]